MFFQIKKLIFSTVFNLSLFFILMIGIQNSSIRKKINFIVLETIPLPVSFIVGVSFISGSITGSFFETIIRKKRD